MPQEKLIAITPDKLGSGMFPSIEPTAGESWNRGSNVWFRELSIEQAMGRQKIANLNASAPPRFSQAMTQAFTSDLHKRLYFEDGGIIKYIQDPVPPTIPGATTIGVLNPGSVALPTDYDMETWGDWLAATDGTKFVSGGGGNPAGGLQLWQNTGSLAHVADTVGQFDQCHIIKRLAQHLLVYNTDVLPTGLHWCTANDPTVWTPATTNSARNLNIRNLDSPIVAVCNLGSSHGVYTSNYLIMVSYLGPTQWFGTPQQALSGIGAVSKHSVVSIGPVNFGLGRGGIFFTDGNSYQYCDRPAIDKWIQQNINWAQASKIAGYYNDRLSLVVWAIPLLGGSFATIAVDPKTRQITSESVYLGRKSFTYLDNKIGGGLERIVFDYPIVTQLDGLYFESVVNTLAGGFTLASNLFDGGAADIYKMWDYAILPGSYGSDAQVQFGFTDQPDLSTVQWGPWVPLSVRVPMPGGPRESVYLALQFQSQDVFRLAGITVFGEKGGFVN